MQSPQSSLRELTVCSICLETFTKPKLLPCGHTFCYSCLMSLTSEKKITCPQCRKVHDIPKEGITGFSENLVLNNLLPIVQNECSVKCADCQTSDSVSKCKHCSKDVCGECLIMHSDLLFEIREKLHDIRESIHSKNGQKILKTNLPNLKSSIESLPGELNHLRAVFEAKREELALRQMFYENYVKIVIKIHTDLLNLANHNEVRNSYLCQLTGILPDSKTVCELQELRHKLNDLEAIIKIAKVENQHPRIDFSNDVLCVKRFGTVKVGDQDIEICGNYHIESPIDIPVDENQAGVSEGHDCSQSDIGTPVILQPGDQDQTVSARGSQACTSKNKEEIHAAVYHKAFPSNVNYVQIGERDITEIGRAGLPEILRLKGPLGMAYHSGLQEIFVADYLQQAVMVYNIEGKYGRIFYNEVKGSYISVAFSDDGNLVYVLLLTALLQVSADGKLLRRVDSFLGKAFTNCRSVVVDAKIYVLDQDHKTVVCFDEELKYVWSFETHFSTPSAMALSTEGMFFITDDETSGVEVASAVGTPLYTFGDVYAAGDIVGIAVDGDGYVCVSRFESHHIDVYDPFQNYVASFGRPGRAIGCLNYPCRLCFTTDGRLIVSDRDNRRLQVF